MLRYSDIGMQPDKALAPSQALARQEFVGARSWYDWCVGDMKNGTRTSHDRCALEIPPATIVRGGVAGAGGPPRVRDQRARW